MLDELEAIAPDVFDSQSLVTFATKREAEALAWRAGPGDGPYRYRPVRVDGGWAVAIREPDGSFIGYL